jgi:hypothetical protein
MVLQFFTTIHYLSVSKKTKMFKKILGMLFVAGMALSACKKEETPAPAPAPTRTEMLTKTWKPDTLIVDGVNVTPLFASARFIFRTDNKYIITSTLSSDTGVWAFGNNETQLILDPGVDQEVWNIETLTTTLMRFNANTDDGSIRGQFSPVQ